MRLMHSETTTTVLATMILGAIEVSNLLAQIPPAKPETAKWIEFAKLEGHKSDVDAISFSPDGRYLASGSDDKTVILWNIQEKKAIRSLDCGWFVGAVAFAPSGDLLACETYHRDTSQARILFWNPQTGQLASQVDLGIDDFIHDLAFSPDGSLLAWSTRDRRSVGMIDMRSRKTLWTQGFSRYKNTSPELAFSKDGKTLAVANGSRLTTVDVQTGKSLKFYGDTRGNAGTGAPCFSPDGKMLVAGTGEGESAVHVWDTESARTVQRLEWGNPYPFQALVVLSSAFSPDGTIIAGGGNDGSVHLWEVNEWRTMQTFRPGGRVSALRFSPDGSFLAAALGKNDAVVLYRRNQ